MALEELITKLTASIDALTAAHKASAGAGGGKAAAATTAVAKPAAEKKPAGPDFDTVKALASKVMDAKGRPFAKKIIKEVGGASDLASVKPEKFGVLVKSFEAAMAEPEEVAEETDAEDEL